MDRLSEKLRKHVDLLMERHPKLACIRKEIIDAYLVMQECYEQDGKLLIAGNGGSAADSEHIAGELMKRFKTPRPVPPEFAARLKEIDPERGAGLAANLERSLMAIPLVAHEALTTAYINDVDGLGVFAQQLYGLADEGDVALMISTSGNSMNCVYCAEVAKAMGLKTISFTGKNESKLSALCDANVRVPETETFKIQEMHLPVYHCLCAMLEEEFF